MKKRLTPSIIAAILCAMFFLSIIIYYIFATSHIKVVMNYYPAIDYPYSEKVNNYMTMGYYINNPAYIPIYIEDIKFIGNKGFEEKRKVMSKKPYGFFVSNQLNDIEKIYSRYEYRNLDKFVISPNETKNLNLCYKIVNEKPALPKQALIKYKILLFQITKKIEIKNVE